MKQFFQCRLQRGTLETIGWIETRGAQVGANIELLPSKVVWTVVEVFREHSMSEDLLKEFQRLHRNSLPSVEGMA